MKFNSKGKLIELTKVEFEDLDFIWNHSTCLTDFIYKITKEYNVNKDVAFNIAMAITNRYKYLDIKDEI